MLLFISHVYMLLFISHVYIKEWVPFTKKKKEEEEAISIKILPKINKWSNFSN